MQYTNPARRSEPPRCLIAAALGVVIMVSVGGCALKSDLDATIAELDAFRQKQAEQNRKLLDQLESRTGAIEASQSDLAVTQGEFRTESDSISSEVARIGSSVAELNRKLNEISSSLKALQNNQAIGLGALSQRLDSSGTQIEERFGTQSKKLDTFATEVSAQVDAQGQKLAQLSKDTAALKAENEQRKKDLVSLNKKINELGTRVAETLASQAKQLQAGGGGDADVAALRKQVDFLGKKLPTEVDDQSKKIAAVVQELREIQTLLADLNRRLKAIEAR